MPNNLENLDDATLIRLWKKGNQEAGGILYKRHKHFCFLICRANSFDLSQEDIEDVIQTVFAKITVKFQERQNELYEAKFTTYLHQALVNTCINQRKKTNIRKVYTSDFANNFPKNTLNPSFGEQQIKKIIDKACATMSAQESDYFRLHHLDGKEIQEIAKIRTVGRNTVGRHLKTAKIKLIKYIKENF